MEDDQDQPPESLMPYADWAEAALRQVVVRAIRHAQDNGLPGEHHFFLTFRTDLPGVVIPPRLLAQYPHEMSIVLQHQFWDLKFLDDSQSISVGLSFGGVPSTLLIPLNALIAFADPFVQFMLRFNPAEPVAAEPEPEPAPEPPAAEEDAPSDTPQVVSLAAFRRRTPPKN